MPADIANDLWITIDSHMMSASGLHLVLRAVDFQKHLLWLRVNLVQQMFQLLPRISNAFSVQCVWSYSRVSDALLQIPAERCISLVINYRWTIQIEQKLTM